MRFVCNNSETVLTSDWHPLHHNPTTFLSYTVPNWYGLMQDLFTRYYSAQTPAEASPAAGRALRPRFSVLQLDFLRTCVAFAAFVIIRSPPFLRSVWMCV